MTASLLRTHAGGDGKHRGPSRSGAQLACSLGTIPQVNPGEQFVEESSGSSLLLYLAPSPKSGSYYFWGIAHPNS
jgi:hypothetical protein